MKLKHCLAVAVGVAAVVVLALGPGPCAMAGQLSPPPEPSAAEDSAVRWIRKAPQAPLPTVPTAPMPAGRLAGEDESQQSRPETTPEAKQPAVSAKSPGRRLQAIEASAQSTAPSTAPLTVAAAKLDAPANQPRMTLAEAEQTALANHPALVQAEMGVRAAHGRCLQAGLYPNPTIGYIGDEVGADGTAGQQGAFFGQEIVTGGKLRLQSTVAAHEIVEAEHAREAQRKRVLNDVRCAWYEVLIAQRIVQLNRRLVAIEEQGVKAAGDLLAAKEVGQADLLQARIEADSARLRQVDAKNRHLFAWRQLATVMGVPDMRPAELEGDLEGELEELTWPEALERLLAESPQLAEAQAAVQRAHCQVMRENAEWIPNVDVRAGARYHAADENAVAAVEVALPLPVFNRNQGNVYKAQAQRIAAQREVQRVELVLQKRLAAAFREYADARNQAREYGREILPNAQTSLQLVQVGYRQGEYDYLTLLTAQRTYFQVNLAYLESLLQYHSSRVAIEGFLLSGSLGGTTSGL